MEELLSRVVVVKQKLLQLKQGDKSLKVEGAAKHQYHLNPCLKEKAIESFEAKYGLRLPEDYRLFLQIVGNGGAGPGLGLIPLEQSIDFDLAIPFPHHLPWLPFEGNAFEQVYASKENFIKQIYGSTQLYQQLVGEYTVEREEKAAYGGALTLGGEGCGHFWILVVNGAERGHVWADSMVSSYGVFPQGYSQNWLYNNLQFTERLTFLNWYELWLEKSLQSISPIVLK